MGCSTGNKASKRTVWENKGNKDWDQIDRGRKRGTGSSRDWLLTLDLTLWRAAMPCCSKELSPLSRSLCLFPSSSPCAHVRLSKDAERQTWRGRRPAKQSQSHHLDLSKHSGEGGRQKREGKGREIKWEGGLTACMTQGESLDLNTLCVWVVGGGCRETWNWGKSKEKAVWKGKREKSAHVHNKAVERCEKTQLGKSELC